MKKKKSKIPKFKNLEEEREFWKTHSFADYWDEMEEVEMDFSEAVWEYRPLKETIVISMEKTLKDKLRIAARKKGLNPSTLARMLLTEKLQTL